MLPIIHRKTPSSELRERKTKAFSDFENFHLISSINDVFSDMSFKDQFEVLERIGEGANSIVYKCSDRTTKEIYALKSPKRSDPELLEGLRQGYEVMKTLNHKYICKAYYFFIKNKSNTCSIVTEYCAYPDLRKYITDSRKACEAIDETSVADIIKKILITAAYLHEMGVCHRDIKPENVLFNSKTGDLRLIDF